MKIKLKILTIASIILLTSCSIGLEKKITKNWKVSKMEKFIPVTSNNYTPIKMDINAKMSYNFQTENKVKLITQYDSKLNGSWSVNDSIITINIKKEQKNFNIDKLTDHELVLTSGNYKFYLEN
ncbi:hypothetical protein FF125_06820 [Aureibaculum algae]|uniref:Lipocalin-like domain-containing protein n=1 Tax=Aureibaculum algae TaxID=2584122 RepID=A0A5B7TSI5_9FLAO|nr:lipocalin family protein [Aureibaculum algae]QCX38154.1 hypothetical protein FF125_06820 [Aureibaculum algae]